MENLTLIIPAKYESESLPNVLEELKRFNYRICVVLKNTGIPSIQIVIGID